MRRHVCVPACISDGRDVCVCVCVFVCSVNTRGLRVKFRTLAFANFSYATGFRKFDSVRAQVDRNFRTVRPHFFDSIFGLKPGHCPKPSESNQNSVC